VASRREEVDQDARRPLRARALYPSWRTGRLRRTHFEIAYIPPDIQTFFDYVKQEQQ
jgi:hypothetical protein